MKLLSISGLLLLLTVAAASCARSSSTPTVLPATTLSPRPTITGVPELVREPPSTSTAMPEQTIAPETMTPTDLPTTPATTLPSRPTAEPTPVPSHTPTPASNFAPTSTPRPTPVPTPEPTRTPEPTPAPTTAPTPTPGPTLDQIPLPASVLAENIGSLSARIVGLRFFESPLTGVPRDQRVYARSFPRSTTRFLNWELALVFPTPGRQSDVVIDSVFLRNGGDILARQNTKVTINADWTSVWHSVGIGWNDPGQWAAGLYRVELSVENELAATAWFKITDGPLVNIATDSLILLRIRWHS